MKNPIVLFLFLLMTVPPSTELQAQSVRLTPELLWQVGRVSLDCVSPDGRYAVYGVTRFDVAKNSSARVLYIVNIATGETRALTDPNQTASSAEFRPDGKRIGFLLNDRLHEVSPEGSPIQKVSDLEMNGFHYAPNGEYVLFTQNVKLDQTAAEKYPDLPNTTGRIIDGLFYRHWKNWHDYKYSNVFYIACKDGQTSGEPVNIMNERFDSPLRPLGGMEQICWSPNSKFILYTCRKLQGTAEAQSTNSDIYAYELVSKKTVNLSADLPGYDLEPAYSPDGRYLVWTSMARPGYEADRTRIMLFDTYTNQRRELTEGWDFEANHPQWAADGKSLYFLSAEDFTYQIYQIGIEDGKIRRLTSGQHDYTVLKVAGNTLVATRVSMTAPPEVYRVDPATGAAQRLSDATDQPWASVAKATVQRRTVRTTDGKNLNVWVVLPPDFDPKKKYPALLYCQGGPQSALSQNFSFRWNPQLMASQGYVVVAPCRRGMPGAGTAWNDAIMGDWAGKPSQDLLDAIDNVAREPWIDAQRLGAVGASYGGYSVYWLAGNHNKRFKAFISHCGLFNLESFYGTTEEVWFPQNDLGNPYWDPKNRDLFEKQSPHRYVQNWDTPILVIHNDRDYRVPLSEGMQAFQAAQLRGIPSRFLYFPDEGHHMAAAQNSILWQRVFFEWLEQWLDGGR